jgi:hypothetical protein
VELVVGKTKEAPKEPKAVMDDAESEVMRKQQQQHQIKHELRRKEEEAEMETSSLLTD